MTVPKKAITQNSPAAIGMNHNVAVKGVVFHIQTEDLGLATAQVVTHVFAEGGRVVKVARLDYSKHLNSPNLANALPKVVRAHHQAVTRKLLAGVLDSLPDLLVLRPSTEAESAQMSGETVPESRPPIARKAEPAAPADQRKRDIAAIKPGRSVPPKRSPASIWNLLVNDAHRLHEGSSHSLEQVPGTAPSRASEGHEMESAPPSSHSWDQAVQRARNLGQKPGRLGGANTTADPSLSIAELSFSKGQILFESSDLAGALRCFAHCAHLEPNSKRFRAALRRVLDLMDR